MKFKCPHCKQKNKRPKISDFWYEKNVHCTQCGKHIYIKGGSEAKAMLLDFLTELGLWAFLFSFGASFLYFSTAFSDKESIIISLVIGGVVITSIIFLLYRLEKRWFTVYAEDTKTQTTKNKV